MLNYEKLLQVAVAGLSSVCGHHVRIVVYGHANSVGLQVLVFELSVCSFSRETRASPSGASRGLRANGVSLQLTILRKETQDAHSQPHVALACTKLRRIKSQCVAAGAVLGTPAHAFGLTAQLVRVC